MKRLAALAVAIFVIAVAAYFVVQQILDRPVGTGSDPDGEPAFIVRPDDATLSHVAYVHDGDTLYLQPDGTTSRADEVTVRLIGIDTPELRPEIECYAIEARDHLRELLPQGSEVWIAADVEEFDRYGRTLLYLWTTDGRSVNADLVANGYATTLRIAPDDRYWRQLGSAEDAARDAGAGLWGAC